MHATVPRHTPASPPNTTGVRTSSAKNDTIPHGFAGFACGLSRVPRKDGVRLMGLVHCAFNGAPNGQLVSYESEGKECRSLRPQPCLRIEGLRSYHWPWSVRLINTDDSGSRCGNSSGLVTNAYAQTGTDITHVREPSRSGGRRHVGSRRLMLDPVFMHAF